MQIKNLIKIIIVFSFMLIGCSDENQNKSNYKKKTDIPLTGQSIDKKADPSKKVSDFY
jgi:PBP1b-binding outer membrane lipoprotein LpoB